MALTKQKQVGVYWNACKLLDDSQQESASQAEWNGVSACHCFFPYIRTDPNSVMACCVDGVQIKSLYTSWVVRRGA